MIPEDIDMLNVSAFTFIYVTYISNAYL